jgi:hypothetical protein
MKRTVIVNAHWTFNVGAGQRWTYIEGERLTTYHA